MNRRIVLNTGPLIALGKVQAFELIRRLQIDFFTTEQVASEISIGIEMGYSVDMPSWIKVLQLSYTPSILTLANLDLGEASVIEAALQQKIGTVCIDELKGRRAAAASGLRVVGSLGLFGLLKKCGIVPKIRPLIDKAQANGIYYDKELVELFLSDHAE